MAYDATGELIEIFETQQITDKFKKREFCLEIPDGNYPQQVKFQLTQDKCGLLDQFSKGDTVKVAFNLQGKAFPKNGVVSYFTNLQAWRIEAATATANPVVAGNDDLESSDLPF